MAEPEKKKSRYIYLEGHDGYRSRHMAIKPEAVTCIRESHDEQTQLFFEGFPYGMTVCKSYEQVLKKIQEALQEQK